MAATRTMCLRDISSTALPERCGQWRSTPRGWRSSGRRQPVLNGVVTTFLGAADAAVAANGSLVYVPGAAGEGRRPSYRWIDRDVHRHCPVSRWTATAIYACHPKGSGWRSLPRTTSGSIVWLASRGASSRPILRVSSSPLWSRDGLRVIFTSNRAGYPQLFSPPRIARVATSCSRAGEGFSRPARPRLAGRRQTVLVHRGAAGRLRNCRDRYRAPFSFPNTGKRWRHRQCDPFSRQTLDRLSISRLRSTGDLCGEVSGARRSAADFDGRGTSSPVVA